MYDVTRDGPDEEERGVHHDVRKGIDQPPRHDERDTGAGRKHCPIYLPVYWFVRHFQHLNRVRLRNTVKRSSLPSFPSGGTALRTQVEIFADIFLALNFRYPAEFIQWMKLLEVPNFPTAYVSATDKEQFMRKIIK